MESNAILPGSGTPTPEKPQLSKVQFDIDGFVRRYIECKIEREAGQLLADIVSGHVVRELAGLDVAGRQEGDAAGACTASRQWS